MNDKELLYIKTIADEKSISAAAKELYIAQPSLSQSLQKIENELGVELFIRQPRGMKLTYAGEKYYLMAKEILDIYNDFKLEITSINELKSGRVSIGIARHVGVNVLPEIIPEFNKKYPNVEIEIREENTPMLEELTLNGNVDFSLTHVHRRNMNSKLNYEILKEDYFLLITHKGFSKEYKNFIEKDGKKYVDLKDLKDEKFILLEKNRGIRKVQDKIFESYGISPDIILTTKHFETAKRIVEKGTGFTLLPSDYLSVFKDDKDYEFFELCKTTENTWLKCILTIPHVYKSVASKILIESIKRHYEK